jgi:prepilin-type processing-associated H-X9-DG protein
MTISFTCPHCGKQTDVADKYAGQTGPCSGCGQTITIPGPAVVPPSASLPPAPAAQSSATSVVIVVLVVCLIAAVLCGGVLVALLLPAIQSAREAARRSQCTNNLKQLAIAMHNYHDTYGCLPPAYIADADGNPMHSWRVLLLPFLEQFPLYERYKFDEPWNSPNNSAVTNQFVDVFRCASASETPSTETNYMLVTGPGTLFESDKTSSFRDVTDGTSNTIMIVEVVGTGVSWAEPKDLDASKIAFPLSSGGASSTGSRHPSGVNVAMGDGSARFISDAISPQTFRALITRAGGEVTGPDF